MRDTGHHRLKRLQKKMSDANVTAEHAFQLIKEYIYFNL